MADPTRPIQDAIIDPVWGQWVQDRLTGPPGVALSTTTATPYSSGVFSNVPWTEAMVERDVGDLFVQATNPVNMIIKEDGWYWIHHGIVFAPNVTGVRGIQYTVGGAASVIDGVLTGATSAAETRQSYTVLRKFTAGQVVAAQAFQNSGAALNVTAQRFSLTRAFTA